MKNIKMLSLFILFAFTAVCGAGEFSFFGKTDKAPLSYKPNEEIVFTVQLLEDGKPVGGKELIWTLTGDNQESKNGTAVSSATKPFTITAKCAEPGFIRLAVRQKEGSSGDKFRFSGSAAVYPEKIKVAEEPKDFDAFWARQKQRLAKVPMKSKMTALKSAVPGYEYFDVQVSCLGAPVSGILCRPAKCAPKSLPLFVTFHGYGVSPAYRPKATPGRLTLDVNAHGFLNEQPKEYYEKLRREELKGYGFSPESNADPEKCYWNGMVLRLLRALEFGRTLPEWNGKFIGVSGGSQGGFQSLAAAGLDPKVTLCSVSVPWMCDIGGPQREKRIRASFRPNWTPALDYYDSVFFARRAKCRIIISAGLGDYVCPPSGIMALYNNIQAPTELHFLQGRTHGYFMPKGEECQLKKQQK